MTITEIKGPHRAGPRRFALTRIYWETVNRAAAFERLRHEMSLSVLWEPRDLWIGLFWEHNEFERWCFYLCLVPCVPLRLKYRRQRG